MKTLQRAAVAVSLGLMVCVGAHADVLNMGPGLTSLETVYVGNAGNEGEPIKPMYDGDPTYIPGKTYGGVDYAYRIGTYEVTSGQYAEFLNAVAATDPFSLYSTAMMDPAGRGCMIIREGASGSYTYSVAEDQANRPVTHVSFGDAARFANWLHNGQPIDEQGLSTTEDGAYFLNGAMTKAELLSVTREADWTWAITSDDEWYKAAYHKNNGVTGDYYYYPTRSDTKPGYVSDELGIINPDPGNTATYDGDGHYWYEDGDGIGAPYWRTEVGEHENSASPYGTFDQGANVWEWTEGVSWGRGLRGGSYYDAYDGYTNSDRRLYLDPRQFSDHTGFRLVQATPNHLPEPATLALLALGGGAVVLRRRR
jgi:formylglycine-generating enzyme required for sulfatase activity